MKIWNSYGSEHSANLIMIGKFKDAVSAEEVKKIIDKIEEFIRDGNEDLRYAEHYSDSVMALLNEVNFHTVGPSELDQFRYDIHTELKGDKVEITTDEFDVSAYMKLMIQNGARIEVYSRHDYPDAEKKTDDEPAS